MTNQDLRTVHAFSEPVAKAVAALIEKEAATLRKMLDDRRVSREEVEFRLKRAVTVRLFEGVMTEKGVAFCQ